MNVGGLDPAAGSIGYATPTGHLLRLIDHHGPRHPIHRLDGIYNGLRHLIRRYPPAPDILIEGYSLGGPGGVAYGDAGRGTVRRHRTSGAAIMSRRLMWTVATALAWTLAAMGGVANAEQVDTTVTCRADGMWDVAHRIVPAVPVGSMWRLLEPFETEFQPVTQPLWVTETVPGTDTVVGVAATVQFDSLAQSSFTTQHPTPGVCEVTGEWVSPKANDVDPAPTPPPPPPPVLEPLVVDRSATVTPQVPVVRVDVRPPSRLRYR